MSVDPKATRGYRNRNPGNIEHVSANKWQGCRSALDGRLPVRSHEHGIRALAALLTTYQDRHGLRTVRGSSAAGPAWENDTGAYVAVVARRMGVGVEDPVDLHWHDQLRPMVEAIIGHECAGLAYPTTVIDRAMTMAGVPPPVPETLRQVATTTGTGRGAVAVGAAGVATVAAQAAPAIQALGSLAPMVAIAVILAAIRRLLWRLRRRHDRAARRPVVPHRRLGRGRPRRSGAVLALLAMGRRQGRAEVERETTQGSLQARERADAASAEYRADGAAGRLRSGRF